MVRREDFTVTYDGERDAYPLRWRGKLVGYYVYWYIAHDLIDTLIEEYEVFGDEPGTLED